MSVTAPRGFRAAGVTAGLTTSGGPDVVLVVNDGPLAVGAAVLTTNRVQAAPVLWTRQAVSDGVVRAVVLTTGGANACTGPEGFADTHATAEHTAAELGASAGDVLVCSTGPIGVRPPLPALLDGVTAAAAALGTDGGDPATVAMMTTDAVPRTVVVERDGWTVGGMAQGAGMSAPGLATVLGVLTTDAVCTVEDADAALRAATRLTFDRVDSDRCMSTNDTVALLASGASGVTVTRDELAAALREACAHLARALVADAEGASHDIAVTVTVTGAGTEDAAVAVARAVSRSTLVQAAVAGADPDWGRVLAAVGTVPVDVAAFHVDRVDVSIDGVQVCRAGGIAADRSGVDLAADREVHILVDLHAGDARATIWTNDRTHDHVDESSALSS